MGEGEGTMGEEVEQRDLSGGLDGTVPGQEEVAGRCYYLAELPYNLVHC